MSVEITVLVLHKQEDHSAIKTINQSGYMVMYKN